MRADFNPPLIPGRSGRWLLTCDTVACGLRGVTLGQYQLPLTAELADDYRAQNAVRQSFPTRR